MRAHLPLLLLALAMCAPAAAAATADFTFSGTFGSAAASAEGVLDGADARALRSLIDRTGDGDGAVGPEEADRFVSSFKGAIGQMVGGWLTGGNATLDGHPMAGSEIGALALDGAAGAVEGGPAIAFRLTMTFLFVPDEEADRHLLAMAGHAAPGGPLQVTVTAPEGWHVGEVAGLGSGIPAGKGVHGATFTMPPAGAFTITFARDSQGVPGPGPTLALLTLAAGAAAGRRRAW